MKRLSRILIAGAALIAAGCSSIPGGSGGTVAMWDRIDKVADELGHAAHRTEVTLRKQRVKIKPLKLGVLSIHWTLFEF